MAALSWIERVKRPGAKVAFRVKWRELVNGKIKKVPSELLYSREEAESVKISKDQELAKISKRKVSAGLAIPWSDLLLRWKSSRLALGHITETYGNEVINNLTRVATINGWKSVADITRSSVEQWRDLVAEKKVVAKGTHKPFRQLKAVLRWCSEDPTLRQPIDDDILKLEQRTQVHRAPPPLLSHDQVVALVKRAYAIGDRFGAIIDHLTRYGCRPIDCCRIRVKDWNARERLLTLRETKNGDDVTHPVDEDFARILTKLCEGLGQASPLYLSPKMEPWKINQLGMAVELRDWYRNRISSYELPREQWGIYLLKDYAITSMKADGLDDATIALFTGHRDLSCLRRYHTTNLSNARAALEQRAVGAKLRNRGGRIGGKSEVEGATMVAKHPSTENENDDIPIKIRINHD